MKQYEKKEKQQTAQALVQALFQNKLTVFVE
jgi:hypothetical protein